MNNNKFKQAAALLSVFLAFTTGYAQTSKADPKDVQGWYGAELKWDLPKKWELNFDYQARFYNNLAAYKGSYFSISPGKNFSKYFSAFAEYRLALVDKGTYHRYSLGAEYKYKFFKLQTSLRGVIQNQLQDFDDEEKLSDKDFYWRIRLKAQCPISNKLDVYASVEPVMKSGGNYFLDNWRNQVGLKYKVAKSTQLEAYYIYRPDYTKSYNRVFNIVGLNISYTIKTKKKEDKKDK